VSQFPWSVKAVEAMEVEAVRVKHRMDKCETEGQRRRADRENVYGLLNALLGVANDMQAADQQAGYATVGTTGIDRGPALSGSDTPASPDRAQGGGTGTEPIGGLSGKRA